MNCLRQSLLILLLLSLCPGLASANRLDVFETGKTFPTDFLFKDCIKEIPEYAEFWRKNRPRGIEVVGIVMDSGSPDDVLDFVNEYRIPYRQLLGDQEIAAAFGVNQGYPTTFVIDGEGMIRTKMLGSPPTKFEKLQETVDAALEG